MFSGAVGENRSDVGVVTPTFQEPRLREFIESHPWADWSDDEDSKVFSVLGSFDRFRIEDWNFEIENFESLPEPGPLREIIEWLQSPENRGLISAYYRKNCLNVDMNALAENLWKRLRLIHQLDD